MANNHDPGAAGKATVGEQRGDFILVGRFPLP